MRHVGKGLKKSSKEIDDGKDKQDTPRYIEFKNKSIAQIPITEKCDQTSGLLFQYLALNNNEHLPKNYKTCQSSVSILPNTKN